MSFLIFTKRTNLLSPCWAQCVVLFVWLQFAPLYPLAWPHAHCDPSPTYIPLGTHRCSPDARRHHRAILFPSLTHPPPRSPINNAFSPFLEVVAKETQSISTQFSTKHRWMGKYRIISICIWIIPWKSWTWILCLLSHFVFWIFRILFARWQCKWLDAPQSDGSNENNNIVTSASPSLYLWWMFSFS